MQSLVSSALWLELKELGTCFQAGALKSEHQGKKITLCQMDIKLLLNFLTWCFRLWSLLLLLRHYSKCCSPATERKLGFRVNLKAEQFSNGSKTAGREGTTLKTAVDLARITNIPARRIGLQHSPVSILLLQTKCHFIMRGERWKDWTVRMHLPWSPEETHRCSAGVIGYTHAVCIFTPCSVFDHKQHMWFPLTDNSHVIV